MSSDSVDDVIASCERSQREYAKEVIEYLLDEYENTRFGMHVDWMNVPHFGYQAKYTISAAFRAGIHVGRERPEPETVREAIEQSTGENRT